MSTRQRRILHYLLQEPTVTAWQLSQPWRVDAPIPSIRRDIGNLRQMGYVINTTRHASGTQAYVLQVAK